MNVHPRPLTGEKKETIAFYSQDRRAHYQISYNEAIRVSSRNSADTIGHSSFDLYVVRSASTIFILAALKAGSTPPIKPIPRAKIRALVTIPGVRLNLKASSEKV